MIKHMNERGLTRAEVGTDAQESWHDCVVEQSKGLLSNTVDSWMTSVNSNLEGRQRRIVPRYTGSMQAFRSRCEEVARNGYKDLNLS